MVVSPAAGPAPAAAVAVNAQPATRRMSIRRGPVAAPSRICRPTTAISSPASCAGHLIPGCGQGTVQAEVCGLVNDTARRLFNPVGPGQLPADAGARGGDLCGPAGRAGKVPPGGCLGAGWDAFPGQASGGDEALGPA